LEHGLIFKGHVSLKGEVRLRSKIRLRGKVRLKFEVRQRGYIGQGRQRYDRTGLLPHGLFPEGLFKRIQGVCIGLRMSASVLAWFDGALRREIVFGIDRVAHGRPVFFFRGADLPGAFFPPERSSPRFEFAE